MKIFYLDCAPFVGGAQESFWSQLQAFRSRAYVVAGDGLWPRVREAGLRGSHLQARHWPANVSGLWQFWQDCKTALPVLREALENFEPDVVHLNCVRAGLLMAELRPQMPVILHDRDLRMPQILLHPLARRLKPFVAAISLQVAEKWREELPFERIEVVPNGFDLEAMRATVPAALPFQEVPGCYRVILAADFIPWKRHGLFLEAVKLAHEKMPSLRAILKGRVRGDHTALDDIFDTMESNEDLRSFVAIDASDAPALPFIAAADTLVACSENEPFGRTVVEALALGKTVAATRDGAAHELFASRAVATAEPTPESLAEAILSWADPQKRTEIAPKARQFAEQFSLARTNQIWEKIYDSVLFKKLS
ncbi:MAG: glycosyltransferase family 4 protein [Victivallales bacterium]|nr:glycosyltransferase family 4 protein [Victivallales bacterium]